MLELASSWTWDFWLADDGERYHVFFLKASRALHDPHRRHWRAGVGHATSTDLRTWTEVADALVAADAPAWDDLATWTGSVVRQDDGRWRMFYTGVDRAGRGLVQRIGSVVSDDLYTWRREGTPGDPVAGLLLEADPRWYEKLLDGAWPDEAWRDPWVLRDAAGDWHMVLTARARSGRPDDRGVLGHARSTDLQAWAVQPPLTEPGHGFGQLEVPQVEQVEGRWSLVFSCLTDELGAQRRAAGERGGIWVADADGPLGPFDLSAAQRLTDETCYAGRLVRDRGGAWFLLAFRHTGPDGAFVGALTDPVPVGRDPDTGRLRVTARPADAEEPSALPPAGVAAAAAGS